MCREQCIIYYDGVINTLMMVDDCHNESKFHIAQSASKWVRDCKGGDSTVGFTQRPQKRTGNLPALVRHDQMPWVPLLSDF